MPVRYGVIGAGAIAQRRHLPEAHRNPQSQIVAVVDPVKKRAEEIAGKYGAKPYADHRAMLASEELDAVVVATPNALHAPQSVDAFKAGCHVLCEKPMATSREDGKRMLAAAKKAGKFLMVGMNQRLMPPHARAKELLDAGKLGRILSFETSFKHRGPDGWSVDGAKSWFFQKDLAVMGVCGDLGIHKADLMRFLLGEEIVRVGATVRNIDKKLPNGKPIVLDDCAFLVCETESGIVGSINIAWTHYGNFEDNGTVLYGEKGVMRIAMDRDYGVMIDYKNGQRERYSVGAVATNTQQVASGVIDSFTDCILKKRPPTIDGDEGYAAMSVIITAMESSEQGKFLRIK